MKKPRVRWTPQYAIMSAIEHGDCKTIAGSIWTGGSNIGSAETFGPVIWTAHPTFRHFPDQQPLQIFYVSIAQQQ